jgi:hypothetical protein
MVFFLSKLKLGEILLIRPKLYLANDGNYRETRWFTTWKHQQEIQTFYLPRKSLNLKNFKPF